MAGAILDGHLRSYRYYDIESGNDNIIAPYQAVSMLSAAQVSTHVADEGTGVRYAPVHSAGNMTFLDRVVGISEHAAKHNTQLAVRTNGIAMVMVNAAVAYGALLLVAANGQRTNAQTPLINLYEANLPVEPGVGVTYNLSLADDTAPTLATTGAGTLHCPVGYALETASAQYDVIRVELHSTPFYA